MYVVLYVSEVMGYGISYDKYLNEYVSMINMMSDMVILQGYMVSDFGDI